MKERKKNIYSFKRKRMTFQRKFENEYFFKGGNIE